MNEECGKTIALEENGGELHLDSSKLSRNKLHNGKCRVYIETPWPYQTVMFYFTEFPVGVSNTRTNVTIRGQNRVHLPELPADLNGNNKSLTNPVRLFEVEDSMSVSYQTIFAGRDSSKFTMTFIYLGDCKVKRLSRCDNGRCVSTDLKCNKTLYACGPGPNECSEDIELSPVGKILLFGICSVFALIMLGYGLVRCCACMKREYPDGIRWNNYTIRNNSDNMSMASPENLEVTERLSLSANEANNDRNNLPDDQFDISYTISNHDITSITSCVSSLDDVTPDNASRTVTDENEDRERCMAVVPYFKPNLHVIDYKFIPD